MHNVKTKQKPHFFIKHNGKILYQDEDKDYLISFHDNIIITEKYVGTNLIYTMASIKHNVIEYIVHNNKKPVIHYKLDKKYLYHIITMGSGKEDVIISYTFNEYNQMIEYKNSFGDIWKKSMWYTCPYDVADIDYYLKPCTHMCPYLSHHIY